MRLTVALNLLLLAGVSFTATPERPHATAADPARTYKREPFPFEEKLLATIPAEYKSPGRHGPYAEPGARWHYQVTFDRKGDGWTPAISPDGERIAYRAKLGGKQFVVVNDKKGPEYDEVRYPVFSPDGRLAYSARLGKKWFVVVGDQKGPEFDSVGPPVFSADGGRLLYGAGEGKKEFVVSGDWRGKEFTQVSSPAVSADGKTVAYVGYDGKASHLYVNDKLVASHAFIAEVTLSPDGGKVAYATERKGKWQIMVGDKASKPYYLAVAPTFNRDGSRLAFLAMKSDWGTLKTFIVVGDEEKQGFNMGVSLPEFMPDGATVVYGGWSNNRPRSLFIGDKEVPTKCVPKPMFTGTGYQPPMLFTGVEHRDRHIFISPDGSKVVCRSIEYEGSEDWFIMSGDKMTPEFDEVGLPVFSPDGRKVAFWARSGREFWRKVLEI